MVEVYLDESGMHQNAPVVSVAAYAAEHREWAAFEATWTSVLSVAGLPLFHAKESRCDPLREPLVKALRAQQIFGWLCTVDTDAYRDQESHQLKSTLGNAYAQAVFRCATEVCLWSGREGLGPAAFVIEHGQANVNFIKETLELFIGSEELSVASVAVARKDEFVPLQAADFLAHCGGGSERGWLNELIGDGPGRASHAHLGPDDAVRMSEEIEPINRQRRRLRKLLKQGKVEEVNRILDERAARLKRG